MLIGLSLDCLVYKQYSRTEAQTKFMEIVYWPVPAAGTVKSQGTSQHREKPPERAKGAAGPGEDETDVSKRASGGGKLCGEETVCGDEVEPQHRLLVVQEKDTHEINSESDRR